MRELPETCSEVRSNLPLYVGRDLEAPILEEVASHLEGCAACRGISRGLEDTRRRIQLLAEGTLADEDGVQRVPDLWPGVRARLVAEGLVEGQIHEAHGHRGSGAEHAAGATPAARRAEPARGRLLFGVFRRAGFGLGAGVAAATLLGMVLLNRTSPLPTTPSTTPVVEVSGPRMEPMAGAVDVGTRPGSVQAPRIGDPARPVMDPVSTEGALLAGTLHLVPDGEKSLLELQAELDEAVRRDHPAFLLLRPGQVQPAGFTRPAGYDRIK